MLHCQVSLKSAQELYRYLNILCWPADKYFVLFVQYSVTSWDNERVRGILKYTGNNDTVRETFLWYKVGDCTPDTPGVFRDDKYTNLDFTKAYDCSQFRAFNCKHDLADKEFGAARNIFYSNSFIDILILCLP